MKHGVLFDINEVRRHTSEDWNIVLSSFDIEYPKPKTTYVNIEGANGSLDLTEAYGKIFFNDRKLTIVLTCKDEIRFDDTLNKIVAFLHGKVAKITPYFDSDYYFYGRVTINKYATSKILGTITINANCEPYKYKQDISVTTRTITDRLAVNFKSDRMESVPTFKSDTEMRFEYNGGSYVLPRNQETIYPDIVFTEGDNFIVFIGNGIVSVEWQEGAL